MSINNYIENNVVDINGINFLKGHRKFDYSDGSITENYILKSIKECSNVSSDSVELESYIKDWPSLYHFSRQRTLAYRALNITDTSRVLEVGCGCGSITRFLGERAGYVFALEGSPRRSEITRERTRDLNNVDVLCASFEDVAFKGTFDIVVCNGVFEYAPLFVNHEYPGHKMLEILSLLVAPGGSLIIAIENKLGLRYFSSGKEEHTGKIFDGIEGYSTVNNGPRTYGAKELRQMLEDKFSNVELLLPLPDYKLPTAIIRENLLDQVNCAELFANTIKHEFGTEIFPRMHERLVWHELQGNGLLKDFSNSFFWIASNDVSNLLKADWMGDIYSIKRRLEWATHTQIYAGSDRSIWTKKNYIYPDIDRIHDSPVTHHIEGTCWVDGVSIHTAVVRSLKQRGNISISERLQGPVLDWWAGIKNTSEDALLDGSLIDHNWQNSIIVNGQVKFVDGEWSWNENISITWLCYRVVVKFISDETYFVHRWDKRCWSLSPYKMMKTIALILDVKLTFTDISRAIRKEIILQDAVIGREKSFIGMIVRVFEPALVTQVRHYSKKLGYKVFRKFRRILRLE